MKPITILCFFASLFLALPGFSQENADDLAMVKTSVENYFQGYIHRDQARLERAFDTENDADSDAICGSDDWCPHDPTNSCLLANITTAGAQVTTQSFLTRPQRLHTVQNATITARVSTMPLDSTVGLTSLYSFPRTSRASETSGDDSPSTTFHATQAIQTSDVITSTSEILTVMQTDTTMSHEDVSTSASQSAHQNLTTALAESVASTVGATLQQTMTVTPLQPQTSVMPEQTSLPPTSENLPDTATDTVQTSTASTPFSDFDASQAARTSASNVTTAQLFDTTTTIALSTVAIHNSPGIQTSMPEQQGAEATSRHLTNRNTGSLATASRISENSATVNAWTGANTTAMRTSTLSSSSANATRASIELRTSQPASDVSNEITFPASTQEPTQKASVTTQSRQSTAGDVATGVVDATSMPHYVGTTSLSVKPVLHNDSTIDVATLVASTVSTSPVFGSSQIFSSSTTPLRSSTIANNNVSSRSTVESSFHQSSSSAPTTTMTAKGSILTDMNATLATTELMITFFSTDGPVQSSTSSSQQAVKYTSITTSQPLDTSHAGMTTIVSTVHDLTASPASITSTPDLRTTHPRETTLNPTTIMTTACWEGAGNDSDEDFVCDELDSCPIDFENDADSDSLCASVDSCPYDANDDSDSDSICGNVDSCPNHASNDAFCNSMDACDYSSVVASTVSLSPDSFIDIDSDGCLDAVARDSDFQANALLQAQRLLLDVNFPSVNLSSSEVSGESALQILGLSAERRLEVVEESLSQTLGVGTQWIEAVANQRRLRADLNSRALASGVSGIVVSVFLDGASQLLFSDVDQDGIVDEDDSCPFDPLNDADSDGMCSTEFCFDFFFESILSCNNYRPNERLARRCALAGKCRVCSCSCYSECYGNVDACPFDDENDADSDGICGDVDSCPYDDENDFDGDLWCADAESCPYDAFNDIDSDSICGDVDSCPVDSDNDSDADFLCADIDSCPSDGDNDADSDLLCAPLDSCDFDAENDIDSDRLCSDIDSCPDNANNDNDGDFVCDPDVLDEGIVVTYGVLNETEFIVVMCFAIVILLIIVVVIIVCVVRNRQRAVDRAKLAATYALENLAIKDAAPAESPARRSPAPQSPAPDANQGATAPPQPLIGWEPDPQSMTQDNFRLSITQFYQKHHPGRVNKAEGLARVYRDRRSRLFEKLWSAYGTVPHYIDGDGLESRVQRLGPVTMPIGDREQSSSIANTPARRDDVLELGEEDDSPRTFAEKKRKAREELRRAQLLAEQSRLAEAAALELQRQAEEEERLATPKKTAVSDIERPVEMEMVPMSSSPQRSRRKSPRKSPLRRKPNASRAAF